MKLLVLAAGMGSRFGGIKQLASAGPFGETLLEYNLFDAREAGFESVVFLIRKDLEADFRASVLARLPKGLPVELAYQSLIAKIPESHLSRLGASGRTKPWGTGHALLCAEEQLAGQSFGVINADDFYGKRGFSAIADYLSAQSRKTGTRTEAESARFCLAGYRLGGVLPPLGFVSRAVCGIREDGSLAEIVEHIRVKRRGDQILSLGADGLESFLSPDALASMNLWGLDSSIFPCARELFLAFLEDGANWTKNEFYLPKVVDVMVKAGKAQVQVLPVKERYFGLTNPEDLAVTREALAQRTAAGDYHSPLWGDGSEGPLRPDREEA
ncbi:MAG: nucleotidyltransferase [Spirochaetes bacterium]|nr:nucleotidyltransferase [Spirochaetota bacterium]